MCVENVVADTPHSNVNNKRPSELYALGKSPIKVDILAHYLKQYPDQKVALELLEGFTEGFSLKYQGPRIPTEAKNLKSVAQAPEIFKKKIEKEISLDRISGPFSERPLPNLRISPLGLVPKKDGDFRVIHHLSYPESGSVNDFIDPALCSVHYASIDDAVNKIQTLGKGALLGKSDIKSAFRLLPVNPQDFDLLGFKIEEQFYFDKCLPMGASISCSLFEKFSTFIQWQVEKQCVHYTPVMLHYLDDFLFGGQAGSNECQSLMQIFRTTCTLLGVPIAEGKTEGPSTVLTFLGIEIDTENMILRLPRDKLSELKQLIKGTQTKKKATLKTLQSLIGSLNFACQVVRPGRAFIRRIIDLTRGVKKPHHNIRLTLGIKADLNMWLEFLEGYNGVTLMPDMFWASNDALEIFTDSAGGKEMGLGIYFQGRWAFSQWPKKWFDMGLLRNITFLELFPVVVALTMWGEQLQNKKLLFYIDNEAVVMVINKKSSKCPMVMLLVRKLVLITLKYNIVIKAEHIPGKTNLIADAISRCQWARFRNLAPEADTHPAMIPLQVWHL